MLDMELTSVGTDAWGWGTVLAVGVGAATDLLGVDGAADAVLHLDVELGQSIGYNSRSMSEGMCAWSEGGVG